MSLRRVSVLLYPHKGIVINLTYQLQVTDNHTYWANLSLVPRPSETAVICGYISSEQDGTPLTANVSLQWQGSQV